MARIPVQRHGVLLGGWEFSGILGFQTGQPFSLIDDGVAGTDELDNSRPRVTGPLPAVLSGSQMVADARTPNTFLILPLNPIRDSAGNCRTGNIYAALPKATKILPALLGTRTDHRPEVEPRDRRRTGGGSPDLQCRLTDWGPSRSS